MAPLKIPLHWKPIIKGEMYDPSVQLAVLSFKGTCDVREPGFGHTQTTPLAWTHITDGIVLPFADVECDRIHALMDEALRGVAQNRRQAVFGRAIGRVITHELYHIFTGSRHHGNDDVAHPVYTARDLVTDKFEFGGKELSTLRRSFTPVLRALRLSEGVPLKSPKEGQSLFQAGSCAVCHGSKGEGTSVAPALRFNGKEIDSKAFATKLWKDMPRMYRDRKLTPLPLNDDDIDDIVSYLNSLEEW